MFFKMYPPPLRRPIDPPLLYVKESMLFYNYYAYKLIVVRTDVCHSYWPRVTKDKALIHTKKGIRLIH